MLIERWAPFLKEAMRVFYKSTTSNIVEVTNNVRRIDDKKFDLSYVVGDYIYLLSELPFNHFYLSMGSAKNDLGGTISIEYNSANGWKSVVNINDLTNAFSSSGHIEFTPDRQTSWDRSSTNDAGDFIEGLEGISVYDVYAVRISFDQNLKHPVHINYMGHNFSDDIDLFSEFPIFNDNDFYHAFNAGKVSWEEQHIKATQILIKDLISRNVIHGSGQVLDRHIFTPANVQKCAEIIFNSFGADYLDQQIKARKEYNSRLDLKIFKTDKNNNAVLEAKEMRDTSGWLSR